MEGRSTGVGRYLEGLLAACLELTDEIDWVLFFKNRAFDHALLRSQPRVHARFDDHLNWTPTYWEQIRLPRLLAEQRLDALFSPAYSLPPRLGIPSLVTIHDLSFENLPGEFGLRERWRRRLLARLAARSASLVLTDSTKVAREIEKRYAVPPERLKVIPLAVDPRFHEAPLSSGDLEHLPFERPFLLAMGTLLPRRNIDLLIAAFSELAAERADLDLVIAGANRLPRRETLAGWISESGLAGRIHHLDYVEDSLLPTLYSAAELSFYLSSYEGFGLPPLESLARGTPAIVLPGLYLEELWSDYPYVCRPATSNALLALIRHALDRPEEAKGVGLQGLSKVRSLTWAHSARLFLDQVESLLGDRIT